MRKSLVLLGVATLALAPVTARAQDALANLEMQVNLVYGKTFGEVMPVLLEATSKLEAAKGNKVRAEMYAKMAEDSKKGVSKQDPAASEEILTKTSCGMDSLSTGLSDTSAALTDQQRKDLSAGAIAYFKGTRATVDLAKLTGPLLQAISGASSIRSFNQLGKAMRLVRVAKMLTQGIPSVGKANIGAANALKNYVVRNKLEVPTSEMSW
jgi:hypothetical protein